MSGKIRAAVANGGSVLKAAKLSRASWAAGAIAVALAVGMIPCGLAHAQSTGPLIYKPPPRGKTSHAPEIRRNVNLVPVNVTVTDPYGRLVTGLDQENFRVFEDGKEQQIMRFEEDDVPISIGMIFDVSGSMADKIGKSRMAAVQFFKTANPADEFFLVDFASRAHRSANREWPRCNFSRPRIRRTNFSSWISPAAPIWQPCSPAASRNCRTSFCSVHPRE